MPASTAAYIAEPTIRIDGSPISTVVYGALADFRVEQSIDIPDKATLRFFDPDLSLVDAGTFTVGGTVKVEVDDGGGNSGTVHDGEIVGVTVETGPGGIFELAVTSYDKAHRLARSVRVRTFVDQGDADIVSVIASEHGLRTDVDSSGIQHRYMIQAESDHAFLTRRALALGYRWWIADGTLSFKRIDQPGSGLTLSRDDIVSLRIRMSTADAARKVMVRGWNPAQQSPVVGVSNPSASMSNGYGTDAGLGGSLVGKLGDFGDGDRFVTGAMDDQGAADKHADAVGRVALSRMVTVRGAINGNPGLVPGTMVKLTGLGSKLSGDYAVTAVEHVISAERGYISRFRCQGIGASELVDLLAPPRESGRLNGLMIGIVTNIEDPDGYGRVKVMLPTLSGDEESAWARLATPGAGSNRGLQVMPEIDDEVVVGFEQGDPSQPFVLGGLWSAKKPPPLASNQVVKSSRVSKRSLVTAKGHRIEITEDGSTQQILLELAENKGSITLKNEGVEITTPGDVTVKADGAISMKATRDLTLEGQNITVKAQNKVDVQGVEVGVKGKAKAAIQAPATEVKADATLTLSGSAMAELKGGLVKLN